MAAEKCAAVAANAPSAFVGECRGKGEAAPEAFYVLAADTVVSVGRRILGKPRDAAEAAEFLLLLSGRRHRVTTAVCLRHGDRTASRIVETRVKVKRLSDEELSAYLRSGEWRGKAGAYAIQGLFGAFVPEITGSYTNVVGLPLTETAALLTGMGFRVPWETAP
jgi:septum formation protein